MGKEREKRKHIFRHRAYLEACADRILTTSPTREITYNTLKDIFEIGWSEGYIVRIEDSVLFKAKREEHRKASWDKIITHIDDIIFCRPTKQSNNQPK